MHCLELLTPEAIKSLGSTKIKNTKDINGKNVFYLEIRSILVHGNIFSHNYHYDSRVLYTFVPNKSFGQLIDISLKNFAISKVVFIY